MRSPFTVLVYRCSSGLTPVFFFFGSTPPSVPYVKRNGGLTNPMIVVQVSRDKDGLSISFTDQPSTLAISMESTLG